MCEEFWKVIRGQGLVRAVVEGDVPAKVRDLPTFRGAGRGGVRLSKAMGTFLYERKNCGQERTKH